VEAFDRGLSGVIGRQRLGDVAAIFEQKLPQQARSGVDILLQIQASVA
jgi:hypothetical protein